MGGEQIMNNPPRNRNYKCQLLQEPALILLEVDLSSEFSSVQ